MRNALPVWPLSVPPEITYGCAAVPPLTFVSEIPLTPPLEETLLIPALLTRVTAERTSAGPVPEMLLELPPSVPPPRVTAAAVLPVMATLFRLRVPLNADVVPSMADAPEPPDMSICEAPAPLDPMLTVPAPLSTTPSPVPALFVMRSPFKLIDAPLLLVSVTAFEAVSVSDALVMLIVPLLLLMEMPLPVPLCVRSPIAVL